MLRHDGSFGYVGIDPLCQATDEGLGVADDEVQMTRCWSVGMATG